MCASSESNDDLVVGGDDGGGGFDEVVEEGAGLGGGVGMAEALGEFSVEGAGDEGELQVQVNAQGDGAGEGVHVEEVDGVFDGVFDEHAPGVAVDEVGGAFVHLVGDQEGGLVMAQVADGQLSHRMGVVAQRDDLVNDAGGAVFAPDIVELDLFPVVGGPVLEPGDEGGGPPAQGQEADGAGLQFGQVGIGGEAAVEDQFLGRMAGASRPLFYKIQDGIVLVW